MQMHANPQLAKIIICSINKNGIEKDRGGEAPKANTAVVTAGDCSFQLFFFLISLPNFKRHLIRNRKDTLVFDKMNLHRHNNDAGEISCRL